MSVQFLQSRVDQIREVFPEFKDDSGAYMVIREKKYIYIQWVEHSRYCGGNGVP